MAVAVRKVVTVLFCDVVEFTTMGEALDPERLRLVMTRFFEEMEAVLVGHGGTVEKFIGDEIMAVFGIPAVHEDDALRAVRAAAAMTERLERLNDELAASWGVRLQMRIGVNTGEVVVGDHSRGHGFVTGDAVNLAKRLETAAEPGQILIGTATYPLVRHAVQAGPPRTFSVKGKADPVSSLRLDGVSADAASLARRLDTPLIGREEELSRLVAEVEAAVHERGARLVTLVGEAGIGKSRLASEFAERLGDRIRFLTGRCLPYGDGITFWPLREIVFGAGGIDTLAEELGPGDETQLVLERIRGVIGSSSAAGGGEETFWAVRKLLEALARPRPLVLCLEDVHWAEPTFLELVEYLAGWIRDAPVVLLCLARPDFSEEHPAWRPGTVMALAPLTENESARLVAALADERTLDEATRVRVAAAAEGNPLFAEQFAALVAEEPSARLSIPPSIHALLAARLDRLHPEERAVLERAAVMGREFWRRAVVELTPAGERARATSHLHSLVRRNLIRPDRASRSEDGFRFSHVLVRDAAYAAIPKETRADLHERFAAWIERNAGSRAVEVEEIVGYHLEQAYRHLEQLGPVDEPARRLAVRAGDLLGRAGRRAHARDDMPAALKLLDRAVALATEQDPARLELVRELSNALWNVGEVARAEALLQGLVQVASAWGDRRVEWYALLEQVARRHVVEPDPDALLETAEQAIDVFTSLDDEVGLARAWRRAALAHDSRFRHELAAASSERSLEHARRAGDEREQARSADLLCMNLLRGPTPADEAMARCEAVLASSSRNVLLEANVSAALAGLHAMRGDFGQARELAGRAHRIYEERGLMLPLAGLTQTVGEIELLARDPVSAERELRRGHDLLVGSPAYRNYSATLLAQALMELDRLDEAEAVVVEPAAAPRADLISEVMSLTVRAALAERRGNAVEAVALAERSVRASGGTDALNLRAAAVSALASALGASGRTFEAERALEEARDLYARKGNVAALARLATTAATS